MVRDVRYSQPARQDIDRCIACLPYAGAMRLLLPFGLDVACARREAGSATDNRQVMPDDHSELVPPLPIPNRTVKRLCADDSAATSVKVGHRQAVIRKPPVPEGAGGFCFGFWFWAVRGAMIECFGAIKRSGNGYVERRRSPCNIYQTSGVFSLDGIFQNASQATSAYFLKSSFQDRDEAQTSGPSLLANRISLDFSKI